MTQLPRFSLLTLLLTVMVFIAACGDAEPGKPSQSEEPGSQGVAGAAGSGNQAGDVSPFALGSVVIDADGNRTTYVQVIESLDDGPFDNEQAIEFAGNGVVLADQGYFLVGAAEEPTWTRYSLDDGAIVQSGQLSLLLSGATRIDYGNAIVDENTAVSVLSDQAIAVIWNPSTMEIVREVDLGHLVEDGYSLEVWTTVAHDGLVYVPGRWSDWEGGRILPKVSITIIDPKKGEIVGIAEDDRCASGGRVVFDENGYGYVMGDGRNYSIHMFANASEDAAAPPDNCLLRIAPGETDFEADYHHTIPSLTGGLQSITELETAEQGTGIGFAKMFHPDELPMGIEPVDFSFWGNRAHKMWRIELADPPSAQEVAGVPFSTVGFAGSMFEGHLYAGESPDGNTSEVYEIDPESNEATLRFEMDGYFNGLYQLRR